MFVNFRQRLQFGVMTIWAGAGRRNGNHLVDPFGLGALPGRVAQRSAELFWLRRRAGGGLGDGGRAPFELTAVQGLELSLSLLVLLLGLLALLSLGL